MPEPFEKRTKVRARTPALLGITGALGLGAFLVVLGVLRTGDLRIAGAVSAVMTLLALWRMLSVRGKVARVRADTEGLTVGEVLAAPRRALTSAVLLRDKGERFVRLEGAFEPLEVAVESDEEGAELLRALEADASSQASVHDVLRGGWLGSANPVVFLLSLVPALVVGGLAHASVALLAGIGVVGVVLAIALSRVRRARLVVGVDGLVVQQGMGAPRFLSHDHIDEVKALGDLLTIHLRDGSRVQLSAEDRLPARRRSTGQGHPAATASVERSAKAHALAARIEEARAAHRALAGGAAVPGLAREGRPAAEWLAALRRLGEEEAGFRASAAVRDRLWEIVESSTAPPADRAAALAALRAGLTPDDEPRVRVAIDRVAAPRVREHLRVALSDDDDAVERALDELSGVVAEERIER